MNKIILSLIIIFIYFGNINANYDQSFNRNYRLDLKGPYKVKLTTKNTACTSPQITHDYGDVDILNLLTISSTNNNVNCTNDGTIITCNDNNITSGSENKISETITLNGGIKDILNALSVSGSIINTFNDSDQFNQDLNIDLKLITDASGNDNEGLTPEVDLNTEVHNVFNGGILEYSDPTECGGNCPSGETCPKIDLPPNPPVPIDYPIIDELGEFNDIQIEGCSIENNSTYVCYATGAINIKTSLNKLAKNGVTGNITEYGIDSIDVSFNNWNNTQAGSIGSIVRNNVIINNINLEKSFKITHHSLNKAERYTVSFQGTNGGNPATKIKLLKLIIIPNNNFRTYRDYVENIDISDTVIDKHIYNLFKYRLEQLSKINSDIDSNINWYELENLKNNFKNLYKLPIDDSNGIKPNESGWIPTYKQYIDLDNNYDPSITGSIENKEKLEAFSLITENDKQSLYNTLTDNIKRKIYLNLKQSDIINKYNIYNNNGAYADNNSIISIKKLIVDSYGNLIKPSNYNYSNNTKLKLHNIIKLDNTSTNNTTTALTVEKLSFTGSYININLKSKTPGKRYIKFDLDIPKHNENTNLTIITNQFNEVITKEDPNTKDELEFKKPFVGELKAVANGNEITATVGTMQEYKLKLNKLSNVLNYTNGSIDIQKSKTKLKTNNHVWEDYNVTGTGFTDTILTGSIGFEGRINANGNVLDGVNIELQDQIISYKIGSDLVKYYITQKDDGDDRTNITLSGAKLDTLGLTVVGNLQGQGKANLTGQDENFSSLQKAQLKQKIRQGAYNIIKNINPGVTNNIKYVEGDFIIDNTEDTTKYETVIVKNGNLIIKKNIENILGIIVLKDNYDFTSDYKAGGAGNILIGKDVTYLNTIMYADGGLLSLEPGKNITYQQDSSQRTSDLQKQLVIYGAIFTKNTIGGSILAGTNEYQLPGGQTTTNYDEAFIYDLNYIRRGNEGWDILDIDGDGDENDGDGNQYNKGFRDSLVVIYNPEIQTNPPKLFK